MTNIDTLEDEIKKALRTFSVSTSAGDFELRPTGEKLIVEQIKQALNLYIEGKIKEARIDELEQIRKEFSAKVADPFKEDNWQGNRLRNAQLYKLIDITKDRIKELESK